MSNSNIKEPTIIPSPTQEENKPVTTNFNFSFTCPKCQATITSQDFSQDHFTIAHLQTYFQAKENEYKQQLLEQMVKEPDSLPAFKQIKEENEKLKLIVEGYKLGSTKNSKTKGEDLEKYVLEKLQEAYNGSDEISKITHVGEKADIIQEIHKDNQQLAKIIYEIKNIDK
jgi:thiol-disulfide isomerase/thioredoxin